MSVMTEDVFKAPRAKKSYMKAEDSDAPNSSLTRGTRVSGRVRLWSPKTKRRRRTKDDFVKFCNIVLAYTQYDTMRRENGDSGLGAHSGAHRSGQYVNHNHAHHTGLPEPASHGLHRHEEVRLRHNSSPLDSGGSTADSVLSDTPSMSDSSNNSIISYIDDNGKESIIAEDDDSQDLITCYCMKPFGGRPMIECNVCLTWVHLSCAKIRKSNIPAEFTCQRCRDSHADTRKSQRYPSTVSDKTLKRTYSPT